MVDRDVSDGGRFLGNVARGIGSILRGLLPSDAGSFRYADRNYRMGGGTEYDGPDGTSPQMLAYVKRELDKLRLQGVDVDALDGANQNLAQQEPVVTDITHTDPTL